MNVLVEVNLDTGAATMYRDNGIVGRTAIATQSGRGAKWDLTNGGTTFQQQLNRSRGTYSISKEEATKIFYSGENGSDGSNFQLIGNKQRAAVLNKNATVNARTYMVDNRKIPFVTDPKSGASVNSKGEVQPLNTAPKPDPPGPDPTPDSQNQTGETPSTGEEQSTTSTPNPVFEAEESQASPEVVKADLRYPLGAVPPGFPFDFIQISAFTYQPSGLDYIRESFSENRRSSFDRIGSVVSTVTLPMQPNLSESHSVGWGGDALDPIRASLASASMDAMKGIGGLDAGKILEAAGGAINDISAMFKDPATIGFVQAYFAGQAVGANITARTTGQVINPNMELLFNGPTLRTFNFNFRLTPRDEPEADEIKKIIRSFKMNMAVQRSKSNLFLKTPNIFLLKYVASDSSSAPQDHPFLNEFKPCAMTGFNVNYTPDGSYMTYDNKSLTAYDMSLSFSELEPIYQDDYTTNYSSHATMGF